MHRLTGTLLAVSLLWPAGVAAQEAGANGTPHRDEWSIKLRGRLQLDAAAIDAPAGLPDDHFALTGEARRAYLGIDGTLPANLGFRVEADFAAGDIEPTDIYLTYKASDELTLTLGQHKPFNGLEEMTSDLFLSMLERAAYTSAFDFERRVGLSGAWSRGDLLVQAGVFTDHLDDLRSDASNSVSVDARLVFSPEVAGGRLHLGASAHRRDLGEANPAVRYRARPFTHTTDVRLVDTGDIAANGERNFGLELAYVRGPFHATVEAHSMTALRPGLANSTFHGGYAEIGMLVTRGDETAYDDGEYDRIEPVRPVTAGGMGAIQLNARYDRLDLDDGLIAGGRQQALGLSALWVPARHVRLLVNYGHLWVANAAVPAGSDADYQLDTFGVRAQVDF